MAGRDRAICKLGKSSAEPDDSPTHGHIGHIAKLLAGCLTSYHKYNPVGIAYQAENRELCKQFDSNYRTLKELGSASSVNWVGCNALPLPYTAQFTYLPASQDRLGSTIAAAVASGMGQCGKREGPSIPIEKDVDMGKMGK